MDGINVESSGQLGFFVTSRLFLLLEKTDSQRNTSGTVLGLASTGSQDLRSRALLASGPSTHSRTTLAL